MNTNELIDSYFNTQKALFEALGYRQDWVKIPVEDCRGCHWMIVGSEKSSATQIVYMDGPLSEEILSKGDFYCGTLYTQRFLPQWVYRTDTHTMISVDTHCDGNKVLMIFDSGLECTDEKARQAFQKYNEETMKYLTEKGYLG